jgi:chorismate mutase / prephenate dehydratase
MPSPRKTGKSLQSQLDQLDLELTQLIQKRWSLESQVVNKLSDENDESIRLFERGKVRPSIRKSLDRCTDDRERRLCEYLLKELDAGCHSLVTKVRVGYLGPEQSYSHLAALDRFGGQVDLCPLATVSAVFDEVHAKNLEFGVVPLENSTDGRVIDTLEMLARVSVRVSAEIPLQIHHCLVGNTTRSAIKRICSKPQALSQCRTWLAENFPDAELVQTSSTTAAADLVARDPTMAAIASEQAAIQYGLRVLAHHIEDNKQNITRFAVIGQSAAPRTGRDKTTVLFELPHEPGALADCLQIFKRLRTNLTWIESFPQPATPQHYYFLVELLGHETDLRVRKCLALLRKRAPRVSVVGSYPAAPNSPGMEHPG